MKSRYSKLVDGEDKIPQDEPVFLLRARDEVAPTVVRIWAQRVAAAGGSKEIVKAAEDQADAMDAYAKAHGGTKVPDL